MAAPAANLFLTTPFAFTYRVRFFKSWLRTNRASHLSGSSDQRCTAFALAAMPPQKNFGAASRPLGYHIRVATNFLAPIRFWLTSRAIRFLQLGDSDTTSNSFAWAEVPPGRFLGLSVTVVNHAKQRVTSNGLHSFKM